MIASSWKWKWKWLGHIPLLNCYFFISSRIVSTVRIIVSTNSCKLSPRSVTEKFTSAKLSVCQCSCLMRGNRSMSNSCWTREKKGWGGWGGVLLQWFTKPFCHSSSLCQNILSKLWWFSNGVTLECRWHQVNECQFILHSPQEDAWETHELVITYDTPIKL